MPINTCLSPLGSICSLKTYCSFPFVKEKQRVILYISSTPVQGLRFFGCWSLVFGPIACASLACQCAAAAAAHEAPPGWDCGWGPKHVVTVLLGSRSLVLGQSMDQFVQTTTCKKRSGNRSGKKPRTTNHQFRNRLKMWETCVFFIQ